MAADVFTRSSGLPSFPLYFFSTQLRTVAPWLLKVIRNTSVSMTMGGAAFWSVAGDVGAATGAASGSACVEAAAGWVAAAGGGAVCEVAAPFFCGGGADLKK